VHRAVKIAIFYQYPSLSLTRTRETDRHWSKITNFSTPNFNFAKMFGATLCSTKHQSEIEVTVDFDADIEKFAIFDKIFMKHRNAMPCV